MSVLLSPALMAIVMTLLVHIRVFARADTPVLSVHMKLTNVFLHLAVTAFALTAYFRIPVIVMTATQTSAALLTSMNVALIHAMLRDIALMMSILTRVFVTMATLVKHAQ